MRSFMRALALLALSLAGCHEHETNVTPASKPPPDMTARPMDLSVVADLADLALTPDLAPPMVGLRFAHLSPDKPPIDVCISTHGAGQWMGPLLKPTGIDVNGLAYNQVTAYLSLPAGQYDVRVVDGGAKGCSTTLFDATNLPALVGGSSTTIAFVGFIRPAPGNSNGFNVQAYSDDTKAAATVVAARFIHASPDAPAVDVGTGSGASFTPLFTNVGYTQAGTSTSPPSDANHYAPLPAPASPPVLTVRATGMTSDLLTVTLPATPPGGTVATIFAIGDVGGTPRPLQALVCVDNAPSSGPLGTCSALP